MKIVQNKDDYEHNFHRMQGSETKNKATKKGSREEQKQGAQQTSFTN